MDRSGSRPNGRISLDLRSKKSEFCSETSRFPASKPEDYLYDDLGADPDDNPPDIPARGWPTGAELFDATLDLDPG